MVTHDEIQEMIRKLTGQMSVNLESNLLNGYEKFVKKKIVLPNAASSSRRERIESPAFLKVEWDKDPLSEELTTQNVTVVDASGKQEHIRLNIVEIK